MSRKKHVEQEYLQRDVDPPKDGQRIGMSLGTRGGNVVEVQFEDKSTTLCMIPAKFHKKLWIRRGGLVIVDETVTGETDAKITGTIAAVLYAEHVKDFKRRGLHIPDFGDTPAALPDEEAGEQSNSDNSLSDIPVNHNKKTAAPLQYTDSDSD